MLIFYFQLFSLLISNKLGGLCYVKVHLRCQKNLSNVVRRKRKQESYQNSAEEKPPKITRRRSNKFNWKDDCLFCGKSCKPDKKHLERSKVFSVTTIEYKQNITQMCDKHFGDPWTSEIKHRLNNCVDLVAEEARYHEQCRKKFFLNFSSTQESPKEIPSSNIKLENFENLCL